MNHPKSEERNKLTNISKEEADKLFAEGKIEYVTPTDKGGDWEKELKNRLNNGYAIEYFEVVEFIESLLHSKEKELKEKFLTLIPEESENFKYLHPENAEFARQLRDLLDKEINK